jgi:hypothetical protein
VLVDWLSGAREHEKKGPVVIDGKTLKGARRKDGTQVHLLSAFLAHEGTTLRQTEVDSKTNEIPALRELIRPMEIKGKVVIADALHTQTATANCIVEEKEADYLFTVKLNQPTLYEDCHALTEALFSPQSPNHR